jgi:DNA-directed RNA polymerase subunit RPC12/RpoP
MASQQRQGILAGVVVVLVVVAGVIYYVRSAEKTKPLPKTQIDGVCVACGKEVQLETEPGNVPPLVCPYCKERTVYAWWYCENCKKLFVPRLIASERSGPPRPEMRPVCPGCGSHTVLGYTAAVTLGYQPEGRLPLPPKEGVKESSSVQFPPRTTAPATAPATAPSSAPAPTPRRP